MNENDALQNQIHEDPSEVLTSEGIPNQEGQSTDSPVGSSAPILPLNAEDTEGGEPLSAAENDTDTADQEALSAFDGQDQNSDSIPAIEDPAMARMRALEAELADLKAELIRRESEAVRVEHECREFHELYPNVSLGTLRDDVWEAVKNGVPIAAAYALSERRYLLQRQKAEQINKENQKRSAGALSGTESSFFSPSEVRSMSPSEVRANYKKIMTSMQKWN